MPPPSVSGAAVITSLILPIQQGFYFRQTFPQMVFHVGFSLSDWGQMQGML